VTDRKEIVPSVGLREPPSATPDRTPPNIVPSACRASIPTIPSSDQAWNVVSVRGIDSAQLVPSITVCARQP
jgi:hypothetical protein